MKNIKKILAVFLMLLMILVQFEGTNIALAAPAKGNTLYRGSISDPISLCPFNATDTASSDIFNQIFRGLLKVDWGKKFAPDLAESMPTFSQDRKTVTFKLKKNVKWDDGVPFTSEDVKYSFDFFMDDEAGAPRKSVVSSDIESVQAPDPYTVVFKMFNAQTSEYVNSLFTVRYIVSKHVLEKVSKKDNMTSELLNKKPVGNGQFKLVEWIPNERVVIEKNPLYEGTQPKIDKIIWKNVGNTAQQLVQLQTGEIDITGISPTDLSYARSFKNINIAQYDTLSVEFIQFNTNTPFFSDKTVRQAIAYAVNKTTIVNSLYKGVGSPADSLYIKGTATYNPNLKKYDYNLAKSKQLLDQAGWKVGKDGIREKNGKKFVVTLMTNKGNLLREKAAVVLQGQLKLIGIKVETRVVDWNTFITKYLRPRKFDIYYGGLSMSDWVNDATSVFHSDPDVGGMNYGSYKNATLDKLMLDAQKEFDPAKNKAMHYKIQEILNEELPCIYTVFGRTSLGTNKRLSNVKYENLLGIKNEYTTWTITP